MDDQALRQIADRLEYLRSLEKKKEEVARLIEESGSMTSEVSQALEKAETLSKLTIFTVRFVQREKRVQYQWQKQRIAAAGRHLGTKSTKSIGTGEALAYLSEELEVTSAEEALQGANDIIAELISDDASIRKRLRVVTMEHALLTSKRQIRKKILYMRSIMNSLSL